MGYLMNDMIRYIYHITDMSLAFEQEKHLNNILDYTIKHEEYVDWYVIIDKIQPSSHIYSINRSSQNIQLRIKIISDKKVLRISDVILKI
jgi:hypothetical protein